MDLPHYISLVSFALGAVFAFGIITGLFIQTTYWAFLLYIASLACFHELEYLMTAIYNPRTTDINCNSDIAYH